MKKVFLSRSARTILSLTLLFSFAIVHAQERNLKKEVLVYILPDSLELPRDIKGSVDLQSTIIRSSTILIAAFNDR